MLNLKNLIRIFDIFCDSPLRNFLDSHPKVRILLRIVAVFIVFLSSLAVFSYIWIINNYYDDITFDVVLFHLRFPLVGVNNAFVYSYVTRALLPSIVVAIFFAIRPRAALLVGLILSAFLLKAQRIIKVSMLVAWQQHISLYQMLITFIKGGYFKSFWWNEPFGVWFVIKAICFIATMCFIIFIIFWIGKKICKLMNLYAQIALFIIVIVLNFWIIDSHFHLRKYLAPKEYGSFYDENYAIDFSDLNAKDLSNKNTNSATPKNPKNARNLIVIFVESMEANFAGKDFLSQGAKFSDESNNENLIPNLHALANRNTNFSTTKGFGGHLQVGRTSWTIAGMIGYMCGIPLNATNSIIAKTFLPSARCISDILATQNYNQMMIMGSDDDFVAKGAFLSSHHIKSNDAKHYKNIGALASDYSHQWGFSDSKLFAFAKDELVKMTNSVGDSRPFALYLLTNNTHYPDAFIEDSCEKSEKSQLNYALKCADNAIFEFISWVKAQDFYENTTIFIVGDHLMNANFPMPRESRRIYNAFINPRFCGDANHLSLRESRKDSPLKSRKDSRKDSPQNSANGLPRQAFGLSRNDGATKSRQLSHFDFAPLILDSLGICTKSFGLGRNPFLGKTLLETNGADFERLINEDSHLYDSFWQR